MPEIGTSGSTSGDGKRSVAAWPKRPRPSSTLPKRRFAAARMSGRYWGEADIARTPPACRCEAIDPSLHLAANFAVMHNAHSETMW